MMKTMTVNQTDTTTATKDMRRLFLHRNCTFIQKKHTLTTAQLFELEFKSLMSPAPRGRMKPANFNCPRICALK